MIKAAQPSIKTYSSCNLITAIGKLRKRKGKEKPTLKEIHQLEMGPNRCSA
jgi:hypothetical protein